MPVSPILQANGKRTSVVSTPGRELFDQQGAAHQAVVIGEIAARVANEAGVRMGWECFIGEGGKFVGMKIFGSSAPFEMLYQKPGIAAEPWRKRRWRIASER